MLCSTTACAGLSSISWQAPKEVAERLLRWTVFPSRGHPAFDVERGHFRESAEPLLRGTLLDQALGLVLKVCGEASVASE